MGKVYIVMIHDDPAQRPYIYGVYKTRQLAESVCARLNREFDTRFRHADFISEEVKEITEGMAREFWRDLMGTLWNDSECKSTHGTMSASLVAEHMEITEETANQFLWACVNYGITDRQNGGFVV